MPNRYHIGQAVRITGTFRDEAEAVFDPGTVKCDITIPDGTTTTYTYPTDSEITKVSTGIYRIDLETPTAGVYHYAWYSTSPGTADQNRFIIREREPN